MTSTGLHDTIAAALADITVPHQASDGDCIPMSQQVTATLAAAGFNAATTTVYGWIDPDSRLLEFVHRATLVNDQTMVDTTATQFAPDLPSLWIVDTADYRTALASACHLADVTIDLHREPSRRPNP